MLDQKTICGRLAERCELLILALLVWSVSSTSEVSAKIEYIKVRLERFQDLLNNTNTAQNRDFQDLRKGACAPAKLRLIHMHIGKSERASSILWPFVAIRLSLRNISFFGCDMHAISCVNALHVLFPLRPFLAKILLFRLQFVYQIPFCSFVLTRFSGCNG